MIVLITGRDSKLRGIPKTEGQSSGILKSRQCQKSERIVLKDEANNKLSESTFVLSTWPRVRSQLSQIYVLGLSLAPLSLVSSLEDHISSPDIVVGLTTEGDIILLCIAHCSLHSRPGVTPVTANTYVVLAAVLHGLAETEHDLVCHPGGHHGESHAQPLHIRLFVHREHEGVVEHHPERGHGHADQDCPAVPPGKLLDHLPPGVTCHSLTHSEGLAYSVTSLVRHVVYRMLGIQLTQQRRNPDPDFQKARKLISIVILFQSESSIVIMVSIRSPCWAREAASFTNKFAPRFPIFL